jgi:hypothetical protein
MEREEIPDKKFEISELKYPIAIFGIDDYWIDLVQQTIWKTNSEERQEKMFAVAQMPGITQKKNRSRREVLAETCIQPYLSNLRIISGPIETYLEVFMMNRIARKVRCVVYDENKDVEGYLELEISEHDM